jgi:hypothetical protein
MNRITAKSRITLPSPPSTSAKRDFINSADAHISLLNQLQEAPQACEGLINKFILLDEALDWVDGELITGK